jgi:hypothetical protein
MNVQRRREKRLRQGGNGDREVGDGTEMTKVRRRGSCVREKSAAEATEARDVREIQRIEK